MRSAQHWVLVLTLGVAGSVSLAGERQVGWDEALNARIDASWADPRHRSFDFWIGEWEMNWRGRPKGQFHFDDEGTRTRQRVFPILGGKALVELAWARDASAETASGRGFSIRYYDESRDRWVMAQHWPGPGNDGFAFLDQLIGFEDNGRLSLYSIVRQRQQDGTFQISHRQYNFADIRDGAFRWDGSNSNDEGVSWATWNVVDAVRIRPLDAFGPAGTAWPGFLGGRLCPDSPHGALDFIEGVWAGTVRRADGSEAAARLTAGRLLDGCAIAAVIEQDSGPRIFSATGYSPQLEKWIRFALDDRRGTGHRYSWSPRVGAGAVFHEAPALSIADEFTPFTTDESFDSESARRRRVWRTLGPDTLAFEEQSRAGSNAPWTVAETYHLVKQQREEL